MRRNSIFAVVAALTAILGLGRLAAAQKAFGRPAVPLVTSDPYLSIWSEADHLTDDVDPALDAPRTSAGEPDPHRRQGLSPDGQRSRRACPPLPQTGVQVLPDAQHI